MVENVTPDDAASVDCAVIDKDAAVCPGVTCFCTFPRSTASYLQRFSSIASPHYSHGPLLDISVGLDAGFRRGSQLLATRLGLQYLGIKALRVPVLLSIALCIVLLSIVR